MVKEKKSKDDNLFKFIGKRIREKRKELKVSQGTIADLLDISDTQIFKFETGESKIALDYLFKLADFFHVDINYFFPENEKITHFSSDPELEKIIMTIKEIYEFKDDDIILGVNNCVNSMRAILKKRQNSGRNQGNVKRKRLANNSK